MTNDNQLQADIQEIDNETIERVCSILRSYNKKTSAYLANIVAAICDVDSQEMLIDTKHLYNSHARWFYWYAYRYMTNESYDSIARKHECFRKFTESCVGICISKISMMIDQESIWKKRWVLVKRVIKAILHNNDNQECINYDKEVVVKVVPPKGVNIKFQVEQ